MITYLNFKGRKVKKGNRLNYHLPQKGEFLLIFLTIPSEKEVKKLTRDFKFDSEPLRTYMKETHSRRYITKPFQFIIHALLCSRRFAICNTISKLGSVIEKA